MLNSEFHNFIMSKKYQVVKGFRDILPPESKLFWLCEKLARDTFARYGYEEILLPVLESYELFARSIGTETDIVEKEMFIVPDKKGQNLVLRPEATASVVRAYIEGLANKGSAKLFYYGPMFRYERPQKGRYRQFWQIGAEAIGFSGPGTDAELIIMLDQYFQELNVKEIEVHINSLGCKQCRPAYRDALIKYLKENEAELCQDCKRRLTLNPLRVLDCKNESCKTITAKAPSPAGFLCPDCASHFSRLRFLLNQQKIQYQIDDRLVRGLDYYTRTVFEFQAKSGLGAQNAVVGGGRYDDLVEELGGNPTPAIGFALGMERLALLLEEKIAEENLMAGLELFLIFSGEMAYQFAFQLLFSLRRSGIYAEMVLDEPSRSLRGQLKVADKAKAKTAVIIGEDELKNKMLNLKFLDTGKEMKLDFASLQKMANIDWDELKSHLQTPGFAFVGQDYEQSLARNRTLLKLFKIYLSQLEAEEK